MTDEHIISETVREQIPMVTGVRRAIGTDTGRELERLYVVLRDAVCSECNGVWMSKLETDFVDIIGRQLMNLTPLALDHNQRERLATWASKVALLLNAYFEATGEEVYIPVDNLKWLADHHTPPPTTQVWLGRVYNEHNLVHFSRSFPMQTVDTQEPVASVTTFSVGFVVFHVTTRPVEEHGSGGKLPALEPPPDYQDVLLRIWPDDGGVEVKDLPVAPIFSLPGLFALAQWPINPNPTFEEVIAEAPPPLNWLMRRRLRGRPMPPKAP